jgi:hypothetical protein
MFVAFDLNIFVFMKFINNNELPRYFFKTGKVGIVDEVRFAANHDIIYPDADKFQLSFLLTSVVHRNSKMTPRIKLSLPIRDNALINKEF